MIEEQVLDLTTDEALMSSLGDHVVEELKLQPYSLLRQAVATDMCDFGGGTFFNAIITVWVCTLSPEDAIKAHFDMAKGKMEAFEWAEKRGYSLFNYKPVVDIYLRLQKECYAASKAHIVNMGSNNENDPNVGGQPA